LAVGGKTASSLETVVAKVKQAKVKQAKVKQAEAKQA
jgi:hypothetical protein